jgi:DNA-binding transcriptional regulator WhiA
MEKIKTIIWDELIRLPTSEPAELSGFLEALPRSESDGMVCVSCPRPVVGRRLLKLWKGLKDSPFNAKIGAPDGTLKLDKRLGRACFRLRKTLFGEIVSLSRLQNGNGKWAWFRGLWGGCGSLYLPQSGYYLTLRLKMNEVAKRATAVLNSADIAPMSRESRGKVEYMLRNQEQIVTCLSKMGLVKSSLVLEETAIVRSIRNRVNKVINCDSANIRKTVNAAASQIALVDRIDAEGLWDRLTPVQAELASARRLNPSASLGELGQILTKPVSKSTVEYRWRKLQSVIDDNASIDKI